VSEFRVGSRKINLEVLTHYFLLGATSSEVAFFLGVTEHTLKEWIAGHPEIAAAAERGQALADAMVAAALFRRATGYKGREAKVIKVNEQPMVVEYDQYYQPDVTAAQFWLRKRRPETWGDAPKPAESETQKETRADVIRARLDSKIARLSGAGNSEDLAQRPVAGRA